MLRPTAPLISYDVARAATAAYSRRQRVLAGMALVIGLCSTSAWSACTRITAQNQLGAGDGTAAAWAGSLDYNNGSLGLRVSLTSVPMQTFNQMAPYWRQQPLTLPLLP